MTKEEFTESINTRMAEINNLLCVKGKEYSRGDRLSNFKKAGELQEMSAIGALGGMLSKHIVSIFDMIADHELHNVTPQEPLGAPAKWDEKINDSIAYLFLLGAVLDEITSGNEEFEL